jgi:hypothetical protein
VAAARVRPPGTVLPPVVLSRQSTTYDARIAFDSVERSYLVMWREAGRFLSSDLSSEQVAANFAGAYENAAYNATADEYMLIRPHCNQPDDESAVCVLRVGTAGAGVGAGAGADRRSPTLRLTVRRLQRIVRQRGLVLRARCDEACSVHASARIGPNTLKLRPTTKSLSPMASKKLKLKTTKRALRKLRRAFTRRSRLKVHLTVSATDPSGNRTIAKRKLRARR